MKNIYFIYAIRIVNYLGKSIPHTFSAFAFSMSYITSFVLPNGNRLKTGQFATCVYEAFKHLDTDTCEWIDLKVQLSLVFKRYGIHILSSQLTPDPMTLHFLQTMRHYDIYDKVHMD